MIAWLKSLLHRLWPATGGRRGGAASGDLDPDLYEVFLAELGEVTQLLQSACAQWRGRPTDPGALKQVRRGFHTLKGSAPLIGAADLGSFCAEVEALMMRLIETPARVTPEVIGTVEQAVAVLPDLAQAARAARPPPAQARAIGERVQRLQRAA